MLVSSLLNGLTERAGDIQFGEGREVKMKELTGVYRVYQAEWQKPIGRVAALDESCGRHFHRVLRPMYQQRVWKRRKGNWRDRLERFLKESPTHI